VPFRWSGQNSHTARAAAASELGELLKKLTQQYPNANIYLIAHSHGGNVALYAIRDDPKAAVAVRGIVNMATHRPYPPCPSGTPGPKSYGPPPSQPAALTRTLII